QSDRQGRRRPQSDCGQDSRRRPGKEKAIWADRSGRVRPRALWRRCGVAQVRGAVCRRAASLRNRGVRQIKADERRLQIRIRGAIMTAPGLSCRAAMVVAAQILNISILIVIILIAALFGSAISNAAENPKVTVVVFTPPSLGAVFPAII